MANLSDINLGIYSYKDEHEQKYNYCIDEYVKRVLAKIFSAEDHSKSDAPEDSLQQVKQDKNYSDTDDVNVFVLDSTTLRLRGACRESKSIFDKASLNLTADDLLDFNAKVTKALNSYSGKYVDYVLLPEYEITNSVFNDPVIHNAEFDLVIKFKVPETKTTKKVTKKPAKKLTDK